jgi:hypothetical protein
MEVALYYARLFRAFKQLRKNPIGGIMATVKKKDGAKAKTPVKKTVNKPAVKKPVKKTTVKKAEKPAAKKPAVKKPVVTKSTVKKAAPVKKTAAVKPAEKKPAVKAAAKAPAATKKPAAVKTPVTGKKAVPVKKQAAKTSAAVTGTQVPAEPHEVKFRNLFDAFSQGKLPFAQGYIVSSFFDETSAYSIYEVVSYAGVKEIFQTDTGLQFVTGGKKLFVLVEPAQYPKKYEEPVSRTESESIPKRFNELETIISAANQTKIMVAKEPTETYGSFTVLKPVGTNFAMVFYQLPDVYKNMEAFFIESLNKQRKIPEHDAKKAARLIAATIEKHMGFKGEYE